MSLVTEISGAPTLSTALSVAALGVATATNIGTLSTQLAAVSSPTLLTSINTGFAGPPGPASNVPGPPGDDGLTAGIATPVSTDYVIGDDNGVLARFLMTTLAAAMPNPYFPGTIRAGSSNTSTSLHSAQFGQTQTQSGNYQFQAGGFNQQAGTYGNTQSGGYNTQSGNYNAQFAYAGTQSGSYGLQVGGNNTQSGIGNIQAGGDPAVGGADGNTQTGSYGAQFGQKNVQSGTYGIQGGQNNTQSGLNNFQTGGGMYGMSPAGNVQSGNWNMQGGLGCQQSGLGNLQAAVFSEQTGSANAQFGSGGEQDGSSNLQMSGGGCIQLGSNSFQFGYTNTQSLYRVYNLQGGLYCTQSGSYGFQHGGQLNDGGFNFVTMFGGAVSVGKTALVGSTAYFWLDNGIRLKPVAGDPATPENGTIGYNSTTHKFRGFQNGAFVNLGGTEILVSATAPPSPTIGTLWLDIS